MRGLLSLTKMGFHTTQPPSLSGPAGDDGKPYYVVWVIRVLRVLRVVRWKTLLGW